METFPGISLSKRLLDASFHVPIAQDQKFHITFLSGYLKRLWTKHHYTATAPFHCTCSENPCFILELLRALNISNEGDIRLFSQRMESCLESMGLTLKESIKSSGPIKKVLRSRKKSKPGITSRSDSSENQKENGNIRK